MELRLILLLLEFRKRFQSVKCLVLFIIIHARAFVRTDSKGSGRVKFRCSFQWPHLTEVSSGEITRNTNDIDGFVIVSAGSGQSWAASNEVTVLGWVMARPRIDLPIAEQELVFLSLQWSFWNFPGPGCSIASGKSDGEKRSWMFNRNREVELINDQGLVNSHEDTRRNNRENRHNQNYHEKLHATVFDKNRWIRWRSFLATYRITNRNVRDCCKNLTTIITSAIVANSASLLRWFLSCCVFRAWCKRYSRARN